MYLFLFDGKFLNSAPPYVSEWICGMYRVPADASITRCGYLVETASALSARVFLGFALWLCYLSVGSMSMFLDVASSMSSIRLRCPT